MFSGLSGSEVDPGSYISKHGLGFGDRSAGFHASLHQLFEISHIAA